MGILTRQDIAFAKEKAIQGKKDASWHNPFYHQGALDRLALRNGDRPYDKWMKERSDEIGKDFVLLTGELSDELIAWQRSIETEILTWRLRDFRNFLVDITLTPAECPGYSLKVTNRKALDLPDDLGICTQAFAFSSVNGSIFEGHMIITSVKVLRPGKRTKYFFLRYKEAIPVDRWLSAFLPAAEASNRIDLFAAAREYVDLVGGQNLDCRDFPKMLRVLAMPPEIMANLIELGFQDIDGKQGYTRNLHEEPTDMVDSFGVRPLCLKAYAEPLDLPVIRSRVYTKLMPLEAEKTYTKHRIAFSYDGILDTQFRRLGSQLLLRKSVLEFSSFLQFREFIHDAPISVLNDVTYLRLDFFQDERNYGLASKNDKNQKQRAKVGDFVFDNLAAAGFRAHPDWTIAMLPYLPSLKAIDLHVPYRQDRICDLWMHQRNPCRKALATFMLESLFPWVNIPGVKLNLSGAVCSSQLKRFNGLFTRAQAWFAQNGHAQKPRLELTTSIRQTIFTLGARQHHKHPNGTTRPLPSDFDAEGETYVADLRARWEEYDEITQQRNAFVNKFVCDRPAPRLYIAQVIKDVTFVNGKRCHIMGDSLTRTRPKSTQAKHKWVFDRLHRPECRCEVPCFIKTFDYEGFFDDTPAGKTLYQEFLKEDEGLRKQRALEFEEMTKDWVAPPPPPPPKQWEIYLPDLCRWCAQEEQTCGCRERRKQNGQ